MTDEIVHREFKVVGGSRDTIRATFYKPRPDGKGDWICEFAVEGFRDGKRCSVFGVDSLQAFLLATVGAAATVSSVAAETGGTATWMGREPSATVFQITSTKRVTQSKKVAPSKKAAK